jgi:hypothetical protein
MLLLLHDMLWRFPETSKKRAKTVSAGNDARRFLSNDALLVGLFDIFHPASEVTAAKADIDRLRAAAEANEQVRGEAGKGNGKGKEVAASKAAPSRKSQVGVAGGGVSKGSSKKKAVAAVSVGGKKATQKEMAAYSKKRAATIAATTAAVPTDATSPSIAAAPPATASPFATARASLHLKRTKKPSITTSTSKRMIWK